MVESEKDSYGHPRIPYRGHYDVKSCNERRRWAEKFSSSSLDITGEWWSREGEDDSVSCLKLKGNVENPIGLAKIPVGLVGPILINGDHVSGYVLCPFATTEGALVASATRGAMLLTRSGGVRSRMIEQAMTRAPAFVMSSVDDAEFLFSWIVMNKQGLQRQVKLFSEYTVLFDIKAHRFGKNIVVAFKYMTNDAAGQNMVTTATWHSCKWLIKTFQIENPSLKIKKFFIESSLSGDKKLAFGNLFSTRGLHVIAEAWIPKSVIETTFKTTVEDMLCLYEIMKQTNGRIGCIGCNINVPNTIAAIFAATGQDIACVAESASAEVIIEPASYSAGSLDDSESGIYACIVLPSLIIGTVGGGTGLATQMECLKMMNCYGAGKVARLGEIIAAVALGLDLSTLASISNGTFALSHEKLGRNKPDNGFKKANISNGLFTEIVKELGTLVSWKEFNVNTENSIVSELTKSEMKKKVGHFGFRVNYQNKEGFKRQLDVVLKSKPIDTETCNIINKMAQNCGFSLASNHEKYKRETGFKNCHIREVRLASLNDTVLKEFSPKVYHTIHNEDKDIYVIVMEFLAEGPFSHLNKADDISEWTVPDIKVVLRDLAKIHAHFHSKNGWIHSTPWIERMGMNEMKTLQPLWLSLLQHAQSEFPNFWTTDKVQLLQKVIQNIPQFWSQYESAPKTLVHNDCNPRNLCLRKPSVEKSPSSSFPYKDQRIACIYDWELARVDIPQHDVAEFLAFTLPVTTSMATRMELIEFYRKHFEYYTGSVYPVERFISDYNVACLDYAINRLLMYTMAHTYKDYHFLPRVIESHFVYIFQNVEPFIVEKAKL